MFLTSDPDTAPAALLHNLKHNKVLHEKNVILTVRTVDAPRVDDDERVQDRAYRPLVLARRDDLRLHGDAEHPARPRHPAQAGLQVRHHGDLVLPVAALDPARPRNPGMPLWQDKLFIALAKSASDATDFFQIPTGRVVEVGTQVTV